MEFTYEEFLKEYLAFRGFMTTKGNTVEQILQKWEGVLTVWVHTRSEDKDKIKQGGIAMSALQLELEMRLKYMK
jgi:predicted RNase H-like HicB family nuclease